MVLLRAWLDPEAQTIPETLSLFPVFRHIFLGVVFILKEFSSSI